MENRRFQYTFEDFRRYKEGRMTKAEMHAFEKATMEDPFLGDALEGFMASDINTSADHLKNISEKIAGKQEEAARVVAMPQRPFKVWRVAAAFILTAGLALMIYKTMTNKVDEQPMARVEETKRDQQIQTPIDTGSSMAGIIPGKDSQEIQKETATANLSSKSNRKDDKQIAPKPKKENDADRSIALQKNEIESERAKTEKVAELKDHNSREVAAAPNTNAYRNDRSLLRGRVAGSNDQPIQGATVEVNNSRQSVVTDRNGNFSINTNDSVVSARVSSQGYDMANVQLRANTDNNVRLQQNNAVLDEVVVNGYGAKRNSSLAASTSKIDTNVVKPEGGWDIFNEYMVNILRSSIDTTSLQLNGQQIELEFSIDKKGSPQNIKVIKSSNIALNKPAINAIKEGVKWTTTDSKKKARVNIRL